MALRTGNASELHPIIGRIQVCFLSRHEMLYGMFKVFIQHLLSKKTSYSNVLAVVTSVFIVFNSALFSASVIRP